MRTYKGSGVSASAVRKAILEQRRAQARARAVSTKRTAWATRPQAVGAPNSLWNARARGVEKKFIDSTVAVAALLAPSLLLVNGVATGTDFNSRIGREILMHSLYMRLTYSNTVDQTAGLRIMLVYDKQPNGVLPNITDVITTADLMSPNNLNNKDRFITISDKIRYINTAGERGAFHQKYKKLRVSTTFSGTTAAIGSISTGAVYVILIPILLTTGAATANFTVGYTIRSRFTDQ